MLSQEVERFIKSRKWEKDFSTIKEDVDACLTARMDSIDQFDLLFDLSLACETQVMKLLGQARELEQLQGHIKSILRKENEGMGQYICSLKSELEHAQEEV